MMEDIWGKFFSECNCKHFMVGETRMKFFMYRENMYSKKYISLKWAYTMIGLTISPLHNTLIYKWQVAKCLLINRYVFFISNWSKTLTRQQCLMHSFQSIPLPQIHASFFKRLLLLSEIPTSSESSLDLKRKGPFQRKVDFPWGSPWTGRDLCLSHSERSLWRDRPQSSSF